MFTYLARKGNQKKIQIGILAAVIMSIFVTSAAAAASQPIVSSARLEGTKIAITITFPDGINGDFAGFMWGKYFDCNAISSNVVYCVGPMASWMRSGVFYLFSHGNNTPVLIKLISIIPVQQEIVPVVTCPPTECDSPTR